jgi:hypothetical protein
VLVVVAATGAVVLVIATNPRTTRSACMGGRARVEILSDLDRRDVRFTPVPSTVAQLRRLREPSGDTPYRRAPPVETTTYRIHVRLLAMKRQRNGDITLAVSVPDDRSEKMFVTFPATRCARRTSRTRKAEMRRAARRLVSACGEPTETGIRLSGRAEVTGVGLFGDRRRSSPTPNEIELAPVLRLTQVGCRRAEPLPRRQAAKRRRP